MILDDVMDELAVRLAVVPGLRVHAWPVGTAIPPAAIVGYPSSVDYGTYQNGMETYILEVVVLVGKLVDRPTRAVLSDYLRAIGPRSIKRALETPIQGGTFDAIEVTSSMATDSYTLAGTDYLASIFTCKIVGSGL